MGALEKFPRFLLRVILALIRLFRKEITRLFAGLRRKQNTYKSPDAKPYQEIRHFGTHIVRHSNLHRNRSIAVSTAQCGLTTIRVRIRLLVFRMPKLAENFLDALAAYESAQFFQPRPLNIGNSPKFLH